MTDSTRRLATLFGFLLLSLVTGCAATQTYLHNDSRLAIGTADSPYHVLTYLRVYEENGDLVLYGKVSHRHGYCPREAHVELAIWDSSGKTVQSESLPLRLTRLKQHGWNGASFRTKLKRLPEGSLQARVVVHDDGCSEQPSFDCGDNRARPSAAVPD